ncbi:MAG: carboxymuconolactone decarboxylase family protein [Phycisphaeraceae bacterium]|nr:carboxymuconolactone decarboxylase family protein [Phycisphaeraceae bacterium]
MAMRMNYPKAAPEIYKAMLAVEAALHASGFEAALLHLVKLRASQINGCAFCIDMHWKDAKAVGETDIRLYSLDAWQESPFYTEKERAALEWTEALTRISETHAPDPAFEELKKHFDEKQIAELSWAISLINAWNRVSIGFRATPGVYQPRKPE